MKAVKSPLSASSRFFKRSFDLVLSVTGLLLTCWLIGLAWVAASMDTGKNGFYTQFRVGKNGRLFRIVKIRTMRDLEGVDTTVTAENDPRITRMGHLLRWSKVDELPQLWNVVLGDMSFVGPRPDVPGFADLLSGEDRVVLTVRPGITGPATLRFRDEEKELAGQADPERYNREVIFPEKIRLNREYVENYSFDRDLRYIFRTLFPQ